MGSLENAITLAVGAHRGQVDKAGQPYILHPLRVMGRVDGERAQMVAVLHDVVDDTEHTLDSLREHGYPEVVLAALDCLTRRPMESYEQFIERICGNPLARRVKLADLEDNLDVRRLARLTEQDVARLRRYQRAWSVLKLAEGGGRPLYHVSGSAIGALPNDRQH